jgi:hypothetical protein
VREGGGRAEARPPFPGPPGRRGAPLGASSPVAWRYRGPSPSLPGAACTQGGPICGGLAPAEALPRGPRDELVGIRIRRRGCAPRPPAPAQRSVGIRGGWSRRGRIPLPRPPPVLSATPQWLVSYGSVPPGARSLPLGRYAPLRGPSLRASGLYGGSPPRSEG